MSSLNHFTLHHKETKQTLLGWDRVQKPAAGLTHLQPLLPMQMPVPQGVPWAGGHWAPHRLRPAFAWEDIFV